jgi:DNA-binding CsgD family transcriptional regulator
LVYFIILVAGILFARNYLLLRIKIRERNIRNAKEKELIRLRNEKLNAELSYRSQELANSTMAIINKNQFLLKLKGILQRQKEELGIRYPDKYYREIIGRIDKNVSSIDDWKVFEFHFEKAHEKFLQKLMHKYPDLTHGDLRLCAYLRLNLSTKEIAPLLRISIRGVENHRYKLRKKLDLGPEENLTEFIMGF